MTRRQERLAVASLLALYAGLGLASARHKTLTADEPDHHLYGRRVLGLDARRLDNSKMPVSAWNALPCRVGEALGGAFPDEGEGVGGALCHRTSARAMTTLVAVVLGLYIHRWASLLYGPRGGLLALALFALCPNFIGHGRLVTTDVYAATGVTAASYHFWRFAELGGWARGARSAVALGAAQLAKVSAVWLYPFLGAVFLLRRALGEPSPAPADAPWRRVVAGGVGLAVVSVLVIDAGFLFEGVLRPLGEYRFRSELFRSAQARLDALGRIPLPVAAPWLEGVDWVKQSDDEGATSGNIYLLGELRDKRDPERAFPHYFLVASLLKLPLGTQLLVLLGAVGLARERDPARLARRELYLLVPCLGYAATLSLLLNSQIGIRLFLPVLPFLFVLAGRVAHAESAPGTQRLAAAAVGLVALSSLASFPHYISYVNELVWDRKMAYRVLADSNLEWGQDRQYLKDYVRRHPDVVVHPRRPMAGRLVVGVNTLVGVFRRPHYVWLREHFEPVDRVAGSYLVFDVTPEALDRALSGRGR